MTRPVAAIVSGLALAQCFEPFNQDWLVWGWMWILLPALWVVSDKRRKLAGFGLGYLSGLAFWLVNAKWLWTVTGLGAVAIAAYLAIYFGVFGVFAASVGNPWRRTTILATGMGARVYEASRSLGYAAALAGFWCGLEWIRGWMLTGFGWNGLGVAFSKSLILAQNAEFVGVSGLSFLPVFLSVVVVQVARRFYQQSMKGDVKLLHWDFATALLLIIFAFTAGMMRFSAMRNATVVEGEALLIQQNIPQVAGRVDWEPQRIVDGFIELTEAGLDEADRRAEEALKKIEPGSPIEVPRPDLVIWPEACLPSWFYDRESGIDSGPEMESIINYVMSLGDFALISGINEVVGDPASENARFFNSLMIQNHSGNRQVFRKHHLVYFGEALPEGQFFRDLFKNTTGVDFGPGLTPGSNFEPLKVVIDGVEVGVIPSVCFEDTVPRLEKKFVRDEPQIIVNVTNDGWFQKSEGGAQHFQNAIFRSIELRRPMLRCANRGVTGIVSITGSTVDPWEREERRLVDENGGHFHRGFLLSSFYVPTKMGVTLYARFGDWFAVGGLIFATCWALAVSLLGRRKIQGKV
ncbi:MAG: apolipoprotein N-acyltransferase [Akkermansiaceae bacterium]